MASNEDERTVTTEQENTKDSKSTSKPPLENPFIAFRRLADETIGSALQSLIGLPSAVTKQLEGALPNLEKIRSDNARINREFEDKIQREHQMPRKLEPHSEATENRIDEAKHDEQYLIDYLERRREEHRKKWAHIREAIQQGPDAAYAPREMDSGRDVNGGRGSNKTLGPQGPFHDFTDLFSHNHMGILVPNMQGPLGAAIFSRLCGILSPEGFGPYIIFSPYSPLFLSNRMVGAFDKYTQDSFPYCDAFEDLLLASRGMEMVPLKERRSRQNAFPQHSARSYDIGVAASWISRLQRQGLLEGGPLTEHEREEEDDGTELGMYSQFLSSAFPKPAAQIPEEQNEVSKGTMTKPNEVEQQQDSSTSSILSTLTRTETKRFPDGRVETKVVLIKRFADGGETRTETVHTNHEGIEPDERRLNNDGKVAATKEEKKGWFWG